jgi:hypothetical protein
MTATPELWFANGSGNAAAVIVESGDYKSVDPAIQTLRTNGAEGLTVQVKASANSGGGGVTVTINGISPAGDTYPLLVSALITGTTLINLEIGPAILAATNLAAMKFLPAKVQVVCVGSGTRTTLTYTVCAELHTI